MNAQPCPTSSTSQGADTAHRNGLAEDELGPGRACLDSYVILRLPAVLKARGRSRSTHYLDIERGLFTHPVSIGARAVGWPEHEVAALNAARIAGTSVAEIQTLVARLEAMRKRGRS